MLLIVVILALIGGLVFCGLKINKLNAKIEEYESKGTEAVTETTAKEEDSVEEKVAENSGLSLEQILSFDESQVKNLKEGQHVGRYTVDGCQYVRVNANTDNKSFEAYIDTNAAKNILNKDLQYASYSGTTPKTIAKIVCCTFRQAAGNDVYVFLYTDGTASLLIYIDGVLKLED